LHLLGYGIVKSDEGPDISSIFGAEEQAKDDTRMKQTASLGVMLPNRRLSPNYVQGAVSQKTELLIVTAVRISNPTA
jgi:hypothetical protein